MYTKHRAVFLKQLIRRNWRTLLIVIALSTDSAAIMLSGVFAYIVRGFIPHLAPFPSYIFVQFVGVFGFTLIILAMIIGVYRATSHSNMVRQYFLASRIYLYAILCLFSFLYIFQSNAIPRRFIFLFIFILPFIFVLGRMLLHGFIHFMQKRGYGIHHVLLAGYDNGGLAVIHRFKNFPELGYDIKGIVTNQKINVFTPIEIHGVPVPRYSMSKLKDIVSENHIDRVFVPSQETITNGYSDILKLCREYRIKLKVLSEDSDSLLRLSRVSDIAGITLYAPQRRRIDRVKRFLKRAFDIAAAALALVVISPIFVITSLAIYIESGMPILFRQRRAAIKGGKTFYFYKYRSMVKNADAMKESLFEMNESEGALFKIKNDPRITKVGKVIRKFSIDELPQFINVLKGEMSIVGPRPLPAEDLEKVEETKEFWKSIKDREKVKPGITGLWQISGRSKVGFREMIWLDLYYVENQSILFDLEIIFATIPVVLFGKGAY
jgi:exopolysaccharide biosynthesis polyprenyl glycosylphosphotransferase